MLDRSAILNSIPQGEPFVFVDWAEVFENSIKGRYTITGQEFFMPGHFPGRPIFPASLLVEALGQLAIVYLSQTFGKSGLDLNSVYFIKSEEVQCRRKCIPGDQLDLHIEVKRVREPLAVFKGSITVGDVVALKVSSMLLSFSLIPNK